MDGISSDRAGLAATLALRPARPQDRPFLLALYASTREQELAQVPFAPEQKAAFLEQQFAAQSAHYAAQFPSASFDVVEVGGEPGGRLIVDRGDGAIAVVDIALLAPLRGRGIGTRLLAPLLAESDARGLPVTLHVERFNPAQRLYARLGFALVADDGVHLRLARPPGAKRSQAKTAS